MKSAAFCSAALVTLIVGALALPARGEEPVAVQRVFALKARMAEDQTVLRQYEWLETITISLHGEVKSRQMMHCSYDAAGAVQKEPFTPPADPEDRRLKLLREIEGVEGTDEHKENKAAEYGELTKYMQAAVRLVRQYIPLNPNGINAVEGEGKLWFSVSDPGKQGQLNIRDFLVRGDYVVVDMDLNTNRPLSLKISSFLDTEGVPASLSVSFGSLYGTAAFVREAVLDAKQLELNITVKNSDFNKVIP